MIKEDYVSYEVAKLLKEKGFDWDCEHYYKLNGEIVRTFHTNGSYHINSSVLYEHQCLAPTQAMAMKWLREKHNLFIWISLRRPNMGLPYCYELHSISTGEVIHIGGFNFGTYEQAVEAALKYCLTELI